MGMGTQAFSIPSNPGFVVVVMQTQGVALSAGANSLGAISSNGVELTLDVN